MFLCALCDWSYWIKRRLTWAELHSPIQKRWSPQTFPKTCSSISDLRIKLKLFEEPLSLLLLQQANLLYHIGPTLPESEVFWLCVTGRYWRVMANLKIMYNAALEHLLNWDFEVCSHWLLFWLPARWCSGSLYLLYGFRRFLPGQGWRVYSDTSKMPRHTQRWRTLPHTPDNS